MCVKLNSCCGRNSELAQTLEEIKIEWEEEKERKWNEI